METDAASEYVIEPEPVEPYRSAWELIDEEWGDDAPMCM